MLLLAGGETDCVDGSTNGDCQERSHEGTADCVSEDGVEVHNVLSPGWLKKSCAVVLTIHVFVEVATGRCGSFCKLVGG